jgi:Tol biopolymer transport system component
MDADGSHVVRLVAAADVGLTLMGSLAWSPDGGRIAFTAFQRSATGMVRNWEIWVVNADGTRAHPLRKTPQLWEFDVDWSPAGDRIAFTDLRRGSIWGRLRVMSTDGKILHSIDPGSAHNTAMPDWAPDGRTLAFVKWPNRMNDGGIFRDAEIWVTTSSGSTRQLTRNTVSDTSSAWSPDGSKIAFVRGSDDIVLAPEKRSAAEIYVMNADGSGVTRLTHNKVGEGSPVWQPIPTS